MTSTRLTRLSQALHRLGPRARVDPALVSIIETPNDYFDALMEGIGRSRHRISLSALYLGTGEREEQLVNRLGEALNEHPDLSVSVLLDGNRGTRIDAGGRSSESILAAASAAFPGRLQACFFTLPQLQAPWCRHLPMRYVEALGVSHVKANVFDDDELILTGANLSQDYFDTRQDRYVRFRGSGGLCNFYHSLVSSVSACEGGRVLGAPAAALKSASNGRASAIERLEALLEPRDLEGDSSSPPMPGGSCWAYPTIQLAPAGLRHDELVTMELFSALRPGDQMTLGTGYLNLTDGYLAKLLSSGAQIDVLAAAPEANGFHTATGISASIPMAYSEIERRIFQQARAAGRRGEADLRLHEYKRDGWTFHAKGIWATLREDEEAIEGSGGGSANSRRRSPAVMPNVVSIGSPNMGRRSVGRDFESQLVLLTDNADLARRFQGEQEDLLRHTTPVSEATFAHPDRRLHGTSFERGHWIAPALRVVGSCL